MSSNITLQQLAQAHCTLVELFQAEKVNLEPVPDSERNVKLNIEQLLPNDPEPEPVPEPVSEPVPEIEGSDYIEIYKAHEKFNKDYLKSLNLIIKLEGIENKQNFYKCLNSEYGIYKLLMLSTSS